MRTKVCRLLLLSALPMHTESLSQVTSLIDKGALLAPFSPDSLSTLDYLAALMEASSPLESPAQHFACAVTDEYATLYKRQDQVRQACDELRRESNSDEHIRHAIFVLLDGYGWNLLMAFQKLQRIRGEESFVARFACCRPPARTVFPATTSAALSSYGSLRLPAHHAQWGWHVRLSKNGRVVQPLAGDFQFSDHLSPDDVFKFRSVFPRLASDEGRAVAGFSAYGGTPFTERMCGEHTRHFHNSEVCLRDAIPALQNFWKEADAESKPSFAYVYAANPDKAEHVHGPFDNTGHISRGVLASLEELDRQMQELCEQSSSEHPRMILMMADHGQYTVEQHVVLPPSLRDMVSAVTVEPATPSFHLRGGTSVAQFRAAWAAAGLDAKWVLLDREELLASGLRGLSLSEEARATLGELTGVALGPYLLKSAGGETLAGRLWRKVWSEGLWTTVWELWGLRSLWRKVLYGSDHKGHHGGAKPSEMLVPVFVWSDKGK